MAGLIPRPFIDDLIDRTDIVDVVRSYISLKKTGKNYTACCPFHNEKSPSFSVSPQKQFYYCFGCGASGNAIGFMMAMDNMAFPDAVEALAKQAGLEVPREELSPRAKAQQKKKTSLYDQLNKAAAFYRQQLRQHEPAKSYLIGRKLSGEIARDYGLGFAPGSRDSLLAPLCGDVDELKLMADAELIRLRDQGDAQNARHYYDFFRDRIMFPIRDTRGRVLAFGGRVLGDQKPKYLNSPESPVFHKSNELYGLYEFMQQRQRPDYLIVVEGYMDVVGLAEQGIRNAVATLGTSIASTHIERIFKQVSQVTFCFDGDRAGRTAALRALDTCLPSMIDGRQAKFLFLPEGEDPDSFARDRGAEQFLNQVRDAKPLSDFLFEHTGADLNLSSADDKALLAHRALPYIAQLPDGLLKASLLTSLIERTGIERLDLERQLTQKKADTNPALSRDRGRQEERNGPESPGAYLEEEHAFAPVSESFSHAAAMADETYGGPPDHTALNDKTTRDQKIFDYLLTLILKSPQLALSPKLQSAEISQLDRNNLLTHLNNLVSKNPATHFLSLHGYLAGYAPDMAAYLGKLYHSQPPDDRQAEDLAEDFNSTCQRLIDKIKRANAFKRHKELEAIPFEQRSPEQKAEQKALFQQLQERSE